MYTYFTRASRMPAKMKPNPAPPPPFPPLQSTPPHAKRHLPGPSTFKTTYSSSSASSSTRADMSGARRTGPVAMVVAVAVVVASAGGAWPVAPAKVDWALLEPVTALVFFFFLGLGCGVC